MFLDQVNRVGTCSDPVLYPVVKPRSPQVWNVTFNPESNQALIRVRTPYHNDYLKVENQLFQLDVWTSTRRMVTSDLLHDFRIK